MFNLHNKLNKFYRKHVRLKKKDKKKLAGYRDINRIESGLDKLGEKDGKEYAYPIRTCNQGSYAMHTLNQHPANDYDIDVAQIFRQEDLPSSALDSRKRIAAAFQEVSGQFSKKPKARTNAVTVWYKEGYHIDFAIYREYEDENGEVIIEHAGPDWKAADPMAVTGWFNDEVKRLSPRKSDGATVKADQMRRIVRFLKAFAKSRDSKAWNLPGGFIISTLVTECYRPDYYRDDEALYDTMVAIREHLQGSLDVSNPVFPDQDLTYKSEFKNQVRRFRDKLGEAIAELKVLFECDCTEAEAMMAWHWIFRHDFWKPEELAENSLSASYLSLGRQPSRPTTINDTGTYG
jgi:hypothetical protein